MSLDKSL